MANTETTAIAAEDLRRVRERLEGVWDRAARLRRRLESEVPTIVRLDKLSREAPAASAPPPGRKPEMWEAEGADLPSEAWEISLINEEGS
jgi:hypothetical protein